MSYFHKNDLKKSVILFKRAKKFKKCEFDLIEKIKLNLH